MPNHVAIIQPSLAAPGIYNSSDKASGAVGALRKRFVNLLSDEPLDGGRARRRTAFQLRQFIKQLSAERCHPVWITPFAWSHFSALAAFWGTYLRLSITVRSRTSSCGRFSGSSVARSISSPAAHPARAHVPGTVGTSMSPCLPVPAAVMKQSELQVSDMSDSRDSNPTAAPSSGAVVSPVVAKKRRIRCVLIHA